jgi:hypothetical protein
MLRPLALLVCMALPGALAAGEPKPVAPAKEEPNLARLKADLRAIIERQRRIRDEVQRRQSDGYPDGGYGTEPPFLDPVIGEVPTLVLKRGQRVTVSQKVLWNRYAEDDLLLWFRASDTSLGVPDKLELNFERHQFRFSYDVEAGTRPGSSPSHSPPRRGSRSM